ncbi:MAG: hypothetical protein SFY70_12725 [Bacteroidia bacterium]|nr:hypothetical protein [Bacteroidia bacterium]
MFRHLRQLRIAKTQWFFIEITAIFLGITGSYLFDEWRQARAEQKQEHKYLELILADLQAEEATLADAVGFYRFSRSSCLQLLSIASLAQRPDSIEALVRKFATWPTQSFSGSTFSRDAARDALKNSRNNALISDLHQLYESSYPLVLEQREIYKSTVTAFIQLFSATYPSSRLIYYQDGQDLMPYHEAQPTNYSDFLSASSFRNQLYDIGLLAAFALQSSELALTQNRRIQSEILKSLPKARS